jgi:hypothetical protein
VVEFKFVFNVFIISLESCTVKAHIFNVMSLTSAVGFNNARQSSIPERNQTDSCRNTYILIVSRNQCFRISIIRMLAQVSSVMRLVNM